MNRKTIGIHIGLYLICVLLFGMTWLELKHLSVNELTLDEVFNNGTDYSNEAINIQMNTSKSWPGSEGYIGAQFDGIIYNNTAQNIENWSIEVEVPTGSWIDSSWNGVYKQIGNKIVITPVDYNQVIRPNTNAGYGMVMYTKGDFKVQHIKMSYHKIYVLKDDPRVHLALSGVILNTLALLFNIILHIRLDFYRQREAKDKRMIQQALSTFANFIDAKDTYTNGHSIRVAHYSLEVGKRMGLSDEALERLYYIALLHDVGKVGVRSEILDKEDALSVEEWQSIKQHTVIGGDILRDFTALPGIAEGAMYHHERYDGTGYPNGLKGEGIPQFARIICIADAYDAMASDRCYRKRLKQEKILEELKNGAGSQFDARLVEILVALIESGAIHHVDMQYVNFGLSKPKLFYK